MACKSHKYKMAVAWIANNDSNGDDDALDADSVSELTTSCLVADVFNVPQEVVGANVVAYRIECAKRSAP